MENEIRLKQPEPEKMRRSERLDAFAKSHFVISGIGFAVAVVMFALTTVLPPFWDFSAFAAAEIVLLAFYAVAGFWHAQKKRWKFSCFREGLWAFLDPALIAWGWAALVLLSLGLNVWLLMTFAFVASAFLAFPSFLMVLLALTGGFLDSRGYAFYLWAFLAGGIPPLLFTLGSLCGSRKNKAKADEKESVGAEEDADV